MQLTYTIDRPKKDPWRSENILWVFQPRKIEGDSFKMSGKKKQDKNIPPKFLLKGRFDVNANYKGPKPLHATHSSNVSST